MSRQHFKAEFFWLVSLLVLLHHVCGNSVLTPGHKIARFLAWDRCPNMLSRCLCLDTEHLSRAQRKVKNTHSICCFRSWTMTSLEMRRGSAICRIPASTPALSSSPKISLKRWWYRWRRISAIYRTPTSTPALSSSPKISLIRSRLKDQRYLHDTWEHTSAVLFTKNLLE